MTSGELFLRVAKDEAETLGEYQKMMDETEMTDEERALLVEIMADEFNHALSALVTAAQSLGLPISTDNVSPDPNEIEVE